MHKIQLYIQKEKAKDPKFQLYISCSIFNLFVSLIFSCLSNHFFSLRVLHLLLSSLQPLDYIEYRHIVQTSVPISLSSSILNRKMQPKKKEEKKIKKEKETWKPHLLHNALQMQCLLAMLQLFCTTAHASLELTCFRAEIPLSGTSTFCESQRTLGEHGALSLMQISKFKKIIVKDVN